MIDLPNRDPFDASELSVGSWLIAVATALVVLVVTVLPHLHW